MVKRLLNLVRYNGIGFCLWRTQYALSKKLGILKRRFPAARWSDITWADVIKSGQDYNSRTSVKELFCKSHFFFVPQTVTIPPVFTNSLVVQQADNILQNRFSYFFKNWHSLGDGPDWFLNPVTGRRASGDKHWCDIGFFEESAGDVKFVWEPSRFAWVYTLVRAWAITKDEKYPQKFWQLIESWLDANQPNIGVNYTCGQECAIRLMAMCFGLYAFARSAASAASRMEKLLIAIAVHADRVERNIGFAVSTKTNHSITEAAGIYTAGLLFKFLKNSDRWHRLGKKIFTAECLKQIYPDGSYIQHSTNYHRLMLQNALWVLRLGQLNYDTFAPVLLDKIRKAAEFLYQIQDETGRVPNYGANDGALIVPLNSCDYLDYRPLLGAMHYFFNRTLLYQRGDWCEDLIWFFGNAAVNAPMEPVIRQSCLFTSGGYYTLTNNSSWAMMRCHSFKDRPGHADMLHLDLWWKGLNILRDSGSYMYNCDEPWQSYFGSTAAHNTIVIDQNDQMYRMSRFMWGGWTKSKLIAYNVSDSRAKIVQGEHYGYCRGENKIIHRRAVLCLKDDVWIIVDDVLGSGTHKIELCWQLCDVDFEMEGALLKLQTDRGPVNMIIFNSAMTGKCECLRGDNRPAGWESVYYGNRKPSPALIYSRETALPVRLVTIVSLGDVVKNAALREGNIVSLISGTTEMERIIVLNSIDNSGRNIFVYIQQGAEKIFCC